MGWLTSRFPAPTASQLALAGKFMSDNAKRREQLKTDTYRFGNPLSSSYNLANYTIALAGIENLDRQFQSLTRSAPAWEDEKKTQLSISYYQYLSEDPNFKSFYSKVGTGTNSNDNYVLDSKWADWVVNTYEGDDVVSVGSGGHRVFVNLGSGNDTFNGGGASDGVFGGTGKDVLRGGDGFDVLDGGADDDQIYGDAGTDMLFGGIGNDFLSGGIGDDLIDGGEGADTLAGGLGDDTYVVDNVGDLVTEAESAGFDTVRSSISYTLGANIEGIILAETTSIDGTGNSLNNNITGNAGNNLLDGGLGADVMRGNAGNDTYVVDNVGDVVTEAESAGFDTVRSTISYTLGANLENLTLIGSAAIKGTGNNLNNVLTGNAAANTLTGGLGNDTYVIGTGDTVVEALNAGTDTVQSSITYTLGANVENLTLSGFAAINGTGNALNNILAANLAANVLTGGAGEDLLTGLGGSDTFRFALADSRLASMDRITDFAIGTDILDGPTAVSTTNTKELGTVATLDQAGISALLTNKYFGANQAATFTFGSVFGIRTFLALNDATAGFSSTSDGLIEITGCTGLLTNLSIV